MTETCACNAAFPIRFFFDSILTAFVSLKCKSKSKSSGADLLFSCNFNRVLENEFDCN